MTRTQFDTWVEKKYPELLAYAKDMEKDQDVAEDLLQSTLLSIVQNKAYEKISLERTDDKNPLYFITEGLKMMRQNQHKAAGRRADHETFLCDDPDTDDPLPSDIGTYNPYPALDDKILVNELYNKGSDYLKVYIDGLRQGYDALEAYNFSGLDISYTFYLRQVKAELSRLLA